MQPVTGDKAKSAFAGHDSVLYTILYGVCIRDEGESERFTIIRRGRENETEVSR
jgi:hypothetical protein